MIVFIQYYTWVLTIPLNLNHFQKYFILHNNFNLHYYFIIKTHLSLKPITNIIFQVSIFFL